MLSCPFFMTGLCTNVSMRCTECVLWFSVEIIHNKPNTEGPAHHASAESRADDAASSHNPFLKWRRNRMAQTRSQDVYFWKRRLAAVAIFTFNGGRPGAHIDQAGWRPGRFGNYTSWAAPQDRTESKGTNELLLTASVYSFISNERRPHVHRRNKQPINH